MKKLNWILLMAFAAGRRAAEAPQTNSPAAGTNEPPAAKVEAATIPAAAYRMNITCAEFDAGHMMHVNLPDLKKMQQDLESFLKP